MAAKEITVKKYVVRLSGEEREQLAALTRKGRGPAHANARRNAHGLRVVCPSLNFSNRVMCSYRPNDATAPSAALMSPSLFFLGNEAGARENPLSVIEN